MPDYQPVESELSVIYPPGKNLSAKVRTLIDFLAARFGPEPHWGEWRKSEGQENRHETVVRVDETGLGRVKTLVRSIAIEQVSHSRPFEVLELQAHSISRANTRMSFSSSFGILSFHTG